MKSTKKIYGVKGIMEWIAEIPCGKATVTVPFTGGSLSGYGIVPAQYMTENPMMQAVIEKSDYYKSGKIILIREMEGSGKYHLPERNAQQSNHMPGQAATASVVMDSPLNPDYKPAQKAEAEQENKPEAEEPAGEAATEEESHDDETVTEDGMKIVEVTDIDAARDYLAETYGIARSNIRYKSNVLEMAEKLKVKFVGLDE